MKNKFLVFALLFVLSGCNEVAYESNKKLLNEAPALPTVETPTTPSIGDANQASEAVNGTMAPIGETPAIPSADTAATLEGATNQAAGTLNETTTPPVEVPALETPVVEAPATPEVPPPSVEIPVVKAPSTPEVPNQNNTSTEGEANSHRIRVLQRILRNSMGLLKSTLLVKRTFYNGTGLSEAISYLDDTIMPSVEQVNSQIESLSSSNDSNSLLETINNAMATIDNSDTGEGLLLGMAKRLIKRITLGYLRSMRTHINIFHLSIQN